MGEHRHPTSNHPGQVQVWKTFLPDWIESKDRLISFLNPGEMKRMERYRFADKKLEFSLSRGILRLVLSAYQDTDPRKVDIQVSRDGKPYLPASDLTFSLSHSRDWFGVAISRFALIGFDLQEIYPINGMESIAARVFSRTEWDYLKELPPQTRQECFFSLWTAREALLKAAGVGFQHSADKITILPNSDSPGEFDLEDTQNLRFRKKWAIREVAIAKGYKACTALEGEFSRLQEISLDPSVIRMPGPGSPFPGIESFLHIPQQLDQGAV